MSVSVALDVGKLEATISELFASALDLEGAGPEDDFFQLGGDSLAAAVLTTEIEAQLGVVLSVSVLLNAPTPRSLASVVDRATTSRKSPALIPVNARGHGPHLFVVHGRGGQSVFPMRLSNALRHQRPLAGFRAIGLEANEQPLAKVETVASAYLRELRQLQPAGPYVVLGHCGPGSLVAYEIAQQLVAAGETVAGLVLIDPAFAPFLQKTGLALAVERGVWANRADELRISFEANPKPTGEMRRLWVEQGLTIAEGRYQPKPYKGPALLLYSTVRKWVLCDPQRGYPALLSDCELVEIDAPHEAIFRDRLPDVARALTSFLDRVAPLEQRATFNRKLRQQGALYHFAR